MPPKKNYSSSLEEKLIQVMEAQLKQSERLQASIDSFSLAMTKKFSDISKEIKDGLDSLETRMDLKLHETEQKIKLLDDSASISSVSGSFSRNEEFIPNTKEKDDQVIRKYYTKQEEIDEQEQDLGVAWLHKIIADAALHSCQWLNKKDNGDYKHTYWGELDWGIIEYER